MDGCGHAHIVVVMDTAERLRCRYCHLTLKPVELLHGYCPECYETLGQKRDDFDKVPASEQDTTAYRCEDCGAVLTPSNTRTR